MTKRYAPVKAAILIVLGSAVVMLSFISAPPVAATQSATTPVRPTATSQPVTMEIAADPVFDSKAEAFVGTGDGSAGFRGKL